MDATSQRMLRAFQVDGRASFVDVAEQLGVAEGTVRRKFAKLVDSGVLKIAGIVNPQAVGYHAPVIMGVKVNPGKLKHVVEELCKLRRVHYVAATTGAYDIILEAVVKDTQELYHFIAENLTPIEGITSLESLMVLERFKQAYDWLDPISDEAGADEHEG